MQSASSPYSPANSPHVTSQDKIDRLSWQVDALSKHLENAHHRDTPQTLRASRTSRHATPRATLAGSSPETTSSQVHAAGSNPPTPEYEGDSALSAHTAFATRFLKTAVNKDRSMAIPPEAASALHDLQQHAKDASHAMEPLHEQLPNATNPGLQPSTPAMTLPPSLVVFAGLQMARGKGPVYTFAATRCRGRLRHRCQRCRNPAGPNQLDFRVRVDRAFPGVFRQGIQLQPHHRCREDHCLPGVVQSFL